MKKTIILITVFIIFLISCQANTGPIVNTDGNVPIDALRSVAPILGDSYLWITIVPGDANSSIEIKFGNAESQNEISGETVTFDANMEDISPTDSENNTTYAFQTGTITGSLEILDEKRAKISFTQNVTPYIKIMEAICSSSTTATE